MRTIQQLVEVSLATTSVHLSCSFNGVIQNLLTSLKSRAVRRGTITHYFELESNLLSKVLQLVSCSLTLFLYISMMAMIMMMVVVVVVMFFCYKFVETEFFKVCFNLKVSDLLSLLPE